LTTDAITTRRRPLDRLAAVVNEISSPILANPMVSIAVGASTGSWRWTALLTVFTGLLPAGIIFGALTRRRISDHHVTDRDERPLIMAAILSSLVLGLAVCLLGDAPGPVTGVDAAMLATLGVLAVITIIGRWKVSVHSAVWAGIAAMLTLTFGPWALLTALAVPVVVWGRVHVRDHTLPQALVGTVTGAIVAGTTFALLH
jgi:hypothetical protein